MGNIIVVMGILAFFLLLRSAASRPAFRDPVSGDLVLQCSPILGWTMGAIAVGGPIGMGILSLIIPFAYPEQAFVPVGIGAFFLLLGGGMCLWAVCRRTRISRDGLLSEYALFKPQFLPWNEVEKVDFASGQEFWVRGKGGKKAMLFVWFVGIAEVVPLLRQYLPKTVELKYRSTIENFAARVGAR